MAMRTRLLTRSMSSPIAAPLANPPATQTTESADMIEAAAACGFVALESLIQVMRSFSKTVSMRCRPGLNVVIAARIFS